MTIYIVLCRWLMSLEERTPLILAALFPLSVMSGGSTGLRVD